MPNHLKDWRKLRGLTQQVLGEAVGTDKTVISKLELNVRKLTRNWLELLGPALDCDPGDILKPPEDVLANEPHLGNTSDIPPVVSDLPGYVPIESIALPVGMGAGGGELDSNYDELEILYFREWTITHELHAKPQDIKHFDVRGQSMTPVLEHGDEVLIDTRDTNPAEPGLFVLWDGDGMVCKWVQIVHGSDPARLKVSSENTRFDPHEPLVEECRIFGRVVWYARLL